MEDILFEGARMETVKRAAHLMNVSTHALYRKIRNGDIPAYRFGRKVLVDIRELRRHLSTKVS